MYGARSGRLHVFRLSSLRTAEDPTPAGHERVVPAALRRKPGRAAEAMTEHLTLSLRRRFAQESEA